MFSFWAPLDEQFFQMMAKLASYKHFDYISAFGHYNWFALTDYSVLQTPPVYPAVNSSQNAEIDGQLTAMQNQLAKQALANRQLSPTGKAYEAVIAAVIIRQAFDSNCACRPIELKLSVRAFFTAVPPHSHLPQLYPLYAPRLLLGQTPKPRTGNCQAQVRLG